MHILYLQAYDFLIWRLSNIWTYYYIIIIEMQSKDKIFSKSPKSLKHSKVLIYEQIR